MGSKFYVRKQISWTMGEIGCGFGLEFTKKSKSKKNHKLLNLLLPSFFYTNVAVC